MCGRSSPNPMDTSFGKMGNQRVNTTYDSLLVRIRIFAKD